MKSMRKTRGSTIFREKRNQRRKQENYERKYDFKSKHRHNSER